jgi:predicted amidophosphoribosyltransferase
MPMSPNDVILANMPIGVRNEKMVCPNCGNIVSKQNYCEVCDNKLSY